MKSDTSNIQRIGLTTAFSILFFCLLCSGSYSPLSQLKVFTFNKECSCANEMDLASNEIETGEDAINLFIMESRKMKFIENKECKFPSSISILINPPSYDIHLPPPKTLFYLGKG